MTGAIRHSCRIQLALVTILFVASAACGKKGPPLPPLVRLPVAPTEVTARRSGDGVTIRFRIPSVSASGIRPADIARVDVYAWTPPADRQLRPEQIYKYARIVGSVAVRRPPPPPPEQKEGEPPPPPPPPSTEPGLDQGALAEITDTLTAADREPLVVPEKLPEAGKPADTTPKLTPPDLGTPLGPPPVRYYIAVGVSRGGRRGAASQRMAIPLWDPPPPPPNVTATVREGGVDLAWTSPEGLRHPLITNLAPAPAATASGPRRAGVGTGPATGTTVPSPPGDDTPRRPRTPDDEDDEESEDIGEAPPAETSTEVASTAPSTLEAVPTPVAPGPTPASGLPAVTATVTAGATTLPSRQAVPLPASASGFMVYEVAPPGGETATAAAAESDTAAAAASPPGQDASQTGAVSPLPAPVTRAPVTISTFTDPRVALGATRCYVVRTVETLGNLTLESVSSAPTCVTARDVFPPAAPKSLGAVSSEGAISLIWEANTEPDLAGYIVLRGLARGGALRPLTPQPIRETTYRDATVRPGDRYVYAVVAVDTASPPNRSPESNRVEETAR